MAGADAAGDFNAGESYVVFGSMQSLRPIMPLASLYPPGGGDGSRGFVLTGIDASDESGRSVSAAGDVRGFYALKPDKGIVSRYTLDGFKEQRRLEIGRKASWLSLSTTGLVVTVAELQEVWVLNADTLDVKARIPVPFVQQDHRTCGPATLTCICRFHCVPADHVAISEAICCRAVSIASSPAQPKE